MSVEIIRVEEPESIGWGKWLWDGAWQQAKDRPYLALPVLAASAVAAPFIPTAAISVGAGAAIGGAASVAAELLWGPEALPPVTYLPIEVASKTRDVHGQTLMREVTYMRHPRPLQEESLIKSSEFHSYIMRQKVSEIIHYLRSETHLKTLSIFVRSSDRKYAVVGENLEKLPVEIKADHKSVSERRMTLTCNDEKRLEHLPNYVWLNDFPEVVAATRFARHGTMSFSQTTDMSFGMTGSFAKYAKFSAGWLSTFVIEVEATFS